MGKGKNLGQMSKTIHTPQTHPTQHPTPPPRGLARVGVLHKGKEGFVDLAIPKTKHPTVLGQMSKGKVRVFCSKAESEALKSVVCYLDHQWEGW